MKEYVKGPEELKVVDLPDPVPKDDEYLIGIRASATNFFDLLQIRGKYQHQPPFPWVAGAEFSGVVLRTWWLRNKDLRDRMESEADPQRLGIL